MKLAHLNCPGRGATKITVARRENTCHVDYVFAVRSALRERWQKTFGRMNTNHRSLLLMLMAAKKPKTQTLVPWLGKNEANNRHGKKFAPAAS